MSPHSGPKAGSKPIAVNEQICQLSQFRLFGAGAEISKAISPARTGPEFEKELGQFATQIRVSAFQAAAGICNGLIQRLPSFNPEHHQVQRCGNGAAQALPARLYSRG